MHHICLGSDGKTKTEDFRLPTTTHIICLPVKVTHPRASSFPPQFLLGDPPITSHHLHLQPSGKRNNKNEIQSILPRVLAHDTRGRAGDLAQVPLGLDLHGAARSRPAVTRAAADSSARAARRGAAVVAEGRQNAVAHGGGARAVVRRGGRRGGRRARSLDALVVIRRSGRARSLGSRSVLVDVQGPVAAADLGGVARALEVAELALAVLEVVGLVAAAPAFVAVLCAEERVALALKRTALCVCFFLFSCGGGGRGGGSN